MDEGMNQKAVKEEPRVNLIDQEIGKLEKGVEDVTVRLSTLKTKLLGRTTPPDESKKSLEAREPGWFERVHRRLVVLNKKLKGMDSVSIKPLMNVTGAWVNKQMKGEQDEAC